MTWREYKVLGSIEYVHLVWDFNLQNWSKFTYLIVGFVWWASWWMTDAPEVAPWKILLLQSVVSNCTRLVHIQEKEWKR